MTNGSGQAPKHKDQPDPSPVDSANRGVASARLLGILGVTRGIASVRLLHILGVTLGVNRGVASVRLLGVLCLTLGVWYVLETRNIPTIEFITGPVGPRTLPALIGTLFVVLGSVLIVKPDDSPSWGSSAVWSRLAAVIMTSFLFGQLIIPIGFISASVILIIVIGLLFKGPILKLLPLSIVFAIMVSFIFNNWLGLRLPAGLWGGF